MKELRLLVTASSALALLGCASAPHRVAEEHVSPDFAGRAYGNLLVMGAYEDRAFRAGSETAFVEELRSRGIEASPSYASISDLASLEDEAAIQQLLAREGHDAVLSVATIDAGYDYDYEDYLETRGLVYLLGGRPGAFTDAGSFLSWAGSGSYRLDLGLWDAASLQPVWQVTTDSQTTGSESGDTQALADFVVETLRSKGLLESSSP